MKNWKTSLLGIGMGILNLVGGGMTWKDAVMSVGMATLGCMAKDFDATGGKNQTGGKL